MYLRIHEDGFSSSYRFVYVSAFQNPYRNRNTSLTKYNLEEKRKQNRDITFRLTQTATHVG